MFKKIPFIILLILISTIFIFKNTFAIFDFIGAGSPKGGNLYYYYYITKEPMVIKNILVPAGSTITYNKRAKFGKDELQKPLSEKKIDEIEFKEPIIWAGLKISRIKTHVNHKIESIIFYFSYKDLIEKEKELKESSPFLKYWIEKEEEGSFALQIKDKSDWSFNPDNLTIIDLGWVYYDDYIEMLETGYSSKDFKESLDNDIEFQIYKRDRLKFQEELVKMNEEMKKYYFYLQKIEEGKK